MDPRSPAHLPPGTSVSVVKKIAIAAVGIVVLLIVAQPLLRERRGFDPTPLARDASAVMVVDRTQRGEARMMIRDRDAIGDVVALLAEVEGEWKARSDGLGESIAELHFLSAPENRLAVFAVGEERLYTLDIHQRAFEHGLEPDFRDRLLALVRRHAVPMDSLVRPSGAGVIGTDSPALVPRLAERADDTLGWTATPAGVGPLSVGMRLSRASAAIGRDLVLGDTIGGCGYVVDVPELHGVHLMVVQGRIVRYEVSDPEIPTAEGARVGHREARIRELYGDRMEAEPHAYVDGEYLVVSSEATRDARHFLVFETDGGVVTTYRGGRVPEVRWIEGCL